MVAALIVIGTLVFLGVPLLIEWWRSGQQRGKQAAINHAALHDRMLSYHLDWDALYHARLRRYHFIKKVNAIRRYQLLTGVSHEQAAAVIEYVTAGYDGLEDAERAPLKRRPPGDLVATEDEERIRRLVANGATEEAAQHLQQLAEVDPFTAQEAIKRLERELWLDALQDADVQKMVADQYEMGALQLARRRYELSIEEAIYWVETLKKPPEREA